MAALVQLQQVRFYWRFWPHHLDPAVLRQVLLGTGSGGRAWLSLSGGVPAEKEWQPEGEPGGGDRLDEMLRDIAKAADQARARRSHRGGSGVRPEALSALLDPARTQALFGHGPDDRDDQTDWSTVDVRFFLGLDEPLIQVAIGFWVRPPAPAIVDGTPDTEVDPRAFRRRCERRGTRADEHADRMDPFPTWMYDEGPPRIWSVVRPDPPRTDTLAATLLEPAQATYSGRAGVLRAVATTGSTYLVDARDHDTAAAELEALQHIEITRSVESHLLDLDLELWSAHLDVYELVAGNVGALWDAVAIRLPAFEGSYLDLVKTLMRRIHQMFSQGMADLVDSASQIGRQAARAENLTERLARLGGSPAESESAERLHRLAARVPGNARRVIEHYKDLLQSIAHAFDERRVHGLDSTTTNGTRLATVFGVFALVSVVDFVVEVKYAVHGSWRWAIIAGMVALLVGVGGIVVHLYRRRRLVTRRGNRWFTEQYPLLVEYHQASSTETLRQRPPNDDALWAKADENLVDRFAALWHSAVERHPHAENPADLGRWRSKKHDIDGLTARIESRMVMLLLLAERPPRLHRYRLPTLTVLLRYVAWLPTPEDFLQVAGLTVVSYTELRMALLPIGLSSKDIADLDLDLKRRIDNGGITTVHALVERIRAVLPDASVAAVPAPNDNRQESSSA